MKTITNEQAEKLLLMFDCIEMWAVNSRGVSRLWEENKELIEAVSDDLLKEPKRINNNAIGNYCAKHRDELLMSFGKETACLSCTEEALESGKCLNCVNGGCTACEHEGCNCKCNQLI